MPNQPVDKFWHYHILDTMKYVEDCEALFGSFLYHYPYFGIDSAEDERALVDAFDDTTALCEARFGHTYAEGAAKCRARCRTACKPMKCK